jgi:hypothetical protein
MQTLKLRHSKRKLYKDVKGQHATLIGEAMGVLNNLFGNPEGDR